MYIKGKLSMTEVNCFFCLTGRTDASLKMSVLDVKHKSRYMLG